jgi:HEPN domain-containing protein
MEEGGHNLACFLSQQAAEKALNGLLFHLGDELAMIHSVRKLCESAAARLTEVEPKCRRWGSLDQFYVSTRYPNALPGSVPALVYDEEIARPAVSLAGEIIDFVQERLASP